MRDTIYPSNADEHILGHEDYCLHVQSASEKLSAVDDLGGYTAILGYAFSQEAPDLSGLFLSFAASWMDSSIFVRFHCDKHISAGQILNKFP
jgi:hypothetical protein